MAAALGSGPALLITPCWTAPCRNASSRTRLQWKLHGASVDLADVVKATDALMFIPPPASKKDFYGKLDSSGYSSSSSTQIPGCEYHEYFISIKKKNESVPFPSATFRRLLQLSDVCRINHPLVFNKQMFSGLSNNCLCAS